MNPRTRIDDTPARLLTQDPVMHNLLAMARQVAPTGCNVLVTGESGTGKERLARYLHAHGTRPDGPFVTISCGAFSEDRLAGELFGNERPAGSQAAEAGPAGLIAAAHGGSLFLDEVAELPSALQVRLLRVIQEGEVRAPGAPQAVQVKVRFIAASNRDMKAWVAQGGFRQDLWYRLNVVNLHLPPLARRRDDVALLARHFLARAAARMDKRIEGFEAAALDLLQAYDYPGNVRELENIIERGVALCPGQRFEVAHLPDDLRALSVRAIRRSDGHIPTLAEQERDYIRWVLGEAGGNQTLAAQLLGIDRVSLWRKLKRYAAQC